MEILNDIPEERYVEVDEFLAYIGIYDDDVRLNNYIDFLKRLRNHIDGKRVVEAGAGFGYLSREILKLNPSQLVAVERNPLTFNVLKKRLSGHPNVQFVNSEIEDFEPYGKIDLLVHEFYGSMLYDENLFSLERLKFSPEIVFPDGGELRAAVVSMSQIQDDIVDIDVLRQLDGILVGDLFPEHNLAPSDFDVTVAEFSYPDGLKTSDVDITDRDGELVAFSVFVTHRGETVCDAVRCENWAIVWTPRVGNRFRISYSIEDGVSTTHFRWLG